MKKSTRKAAPHTQAKLNQTSSSSSPSSSHLSRYCLPDEEAPLSYARAPSPSTTPMGPVFAGIHLLALSHNDIENKEEKEKKEALLALSDALENVENEMHFAEQMEELVRGESNRDGTVKMTKMENKNSMCSKIPFVEMLVETAGTVDRESLRVWLGYVGDVVREFEGVLERSEREAEKDRGRWKEPRVKK